MAPLGLSPVVCIECGFVMGDKDQPKSMALRDRTGNLDGIESTFPLLSYVTILLSYSLHLLMN